MSETNVYEKVGVSLILSALLFIVAYGLGSLLPGAKEALLVAWGIATIGFVLLSYGGSK